ncbi:proto-oncogene c-Fos-like isoform X2 [Elysia marginata]|uniref:Proto-oncogene c-Fos-like isoform X2 n=1 Tax=Elysia marginata TaxID=1093978 RepID=A0AAV4ELR6_9GAST|nr:proto-oncogene c-Fos-like isoform X2 [Elysia marginata]
MEGTAPTPNRRENLRRSIMARRQARGRLSPVKVEKNWNRRLEMTPVDIEKKERRREQNRRAAQRCRTKKRLTQYNVIKNLEKIVEHNRTLLREVHQLRYDKGELRRKWAAHRKICPCFQPNPDQQSMDNYESTMAIKTEPISDEEEEESEDMKKLIDSEGQENEMEFSFASIANVLCSSPIAGFPKNFPEIANISEISDESLSASLCSEMVSCSPSALGDMSTSFLPSPIKPTKDDKATARGFEKSSAVTSQSQLFIQTSQTSSSNFPSREHAVCSSLASSSTTTSSDSSDEIRYKVSAPQPVWQQPAHSPGHNQQKHSTYTPQSSCMYEGTIPHPQSYYTPQQQHMQIPQHLCQPPQHQAYPNHHSMSLGQGYHHTQYSENHSNSNVFRMSASFSMTTSSTDTEACASPGRQLCATTSGAQKPKSAQYPGLCRLLQPHPSPAQVVPSISISSGDNMRVNSPNSTFSGSANASITASDTNVTPAVLNQPNFLCSRPRSVLASGGSTPDTVRAAVRDKYRGRCSSESSDASGHKVPPSASETFFPRRSSEAPEIDNDDVFFTSVTVHSNPAHSNYNFDTNNNSALINNNNNNNNIRNTTDAVNDGNGTSTNDIMFFNHDDEAETSSVLEGVRHLIDCSGYSNSCSNTPNSISSNSSMNSEVDDLLLEIPSDALLFFEANSGVDASHDVFSGTL